jgi:hypothetical protein
VIIMRRHKAFTIAITIAALASCAQMHEAAHDPSMHAAHMQSGSAAGMAPAGAPGAALGEDRRQAVAFPAPMREHTLANMRDHLLALQEIQAALARQQFDRAADLAEGRLGMSSLGLHGAHEVARFMPKGMQDAGTAMHRAASRVALAARDAGAMGDLRPALSSLAELTATCVACHAAYRLE